MTQKIVRCRDSEFESTIEKYENEGYLVSGISWMECNCEFIIVFRESRNKSKKKKDKYYDDFIKDSDDFLKEWEKANKERKNKNTPPDNPYPTWPNVPYIPYDPVNPLIAPPRKPWEQPIIWWCNKQPYYTTHTSPNIPTKSNSVRTYCN